MDIVLLGSGNLASCLGAILKSKRHHILQVYSPNRDHAKSLGDKLEVPFTSHFEQIDGNAEAYILAVRDDAIETVASRLSGKFLIHTSGTEDINSLAMVTENCGVMWPIYSFTKSNCPPDWNNIPICIEGNNEESLRKLSTIANSLSTNILFLNSQQRKKLHLAAVFLNNFINHLLNTGLSIVSDLKIPEAALSNIVFQTIEKAFEIGPENSQTGPAKRHDFDTVRKHIELLKELPQASEIYKLLSEQISGVKIPS
jgi:predicted short-subunit dehydrogenase-like oxidoreductase (DUF2520 family)